MLGTRQWISKVQETLANLDRDKLSEDITAQYLDRLVKQAKKISHVICYIWLNQDPETAKELDRYFKEGDDEKLKKLLFAKDPETSEYKLLLKVLKEDRYLPIFAEEDKKFIKFRVVTDKFEGNISEPEPSDNSIITVTIPYPPRPTISDNASTIPQPGYAAIEKSELQEWLSQSPDTPPYFNDKNPYIPPSSC